MRSVRHSIERLEIWYPGLFVQPHVVAAVAVLSEYSESPATFAVRGENVPQLEVFGGETRLSLSWPRSLEAKAERLRATMQRNPLVELAATAVALVVARRVLALGRLEVTGYGERADFRSPRRRAVLEISGTEVAEEFLRRHREKVGQATGNPFGWDAYVVVCLFSARGHRIRLSRHECSEGSHD
jgi:hypothetical protein